MPAPRTLHLNAFLHGVGHHSAAWRHPTSAAERIGDITYFEELARTAERGCFDAVFFADGHSVNPSYTAGTTWFLEPLTALSAMARATKRIGLVTTVSASFYTPFHAARMLASLDHISGGRAGVNIVTSMFDAEARNHGLDALPDHAERYGRAEEFIEVLTALWGSWDEAGIAVDRAAGRYLDADAIRRIEHRGQHFRVDGPLTVPRCPQGRPVLFQAGASETGRNLAARHAEAVYSVSWDSAAALDFATDLRGRAAAAGRDPASIAILPGLVPYVGRTEDEARAKKATLDGLIDIDAALAQLGVFTGQDYTGHDLDTPVVDLPPIDQFSGPQGRYATVQRIIGSHRPTLRGLLGYLAAGGGHATMIGTPEAIADRIEEWFVAGACDGFNLMCPAYPDSLDDFVDLVVPELQRRGLFRTTYPGTTLRDSLGLWSFA